MRAGTIRMAANISVLWPVARLCAHVSMGTRLRVRRIIRESQCSHEVTRSKTGAFEIKKVALQRLMHGTKTKLSDEQL